LRLICWVISWVVLLWFDVCWCYVVVWLWWCGIRMQAEALKWLFNAQHVSDVNTSILRSLRLICWVISWAVLLWFDLCWCYVVVWLWWCGIRMQAEALVCFIISLFNAQQVSDVNTSILRSLRLMCWVISWMVLIWFDVCRCYVVVWLWWCGIGMQAEALVCFIISLFNAQQVSDVNTSILRSLRLMYWVISWMVLIRNNRRFCISALI